MTEHVRMSGIYWGLNALDLMGKLDRTNKEEILEFIRQCQSDSGGISASIQHDPHLLYTLSAVQILCLYDALDVVDKDKIVKYVKERQQQDGSFTGDIWGEVDTRFSFCAIATLSLLVRNFLMLYNNKYINLKFILSIYCKSLQDIEFVITESFRCYRCGKGCRICN